MREDLGGCIIQFEGCLGWHHSNGEGEEKQELEFHKTKRKPVGFLFCLIKT
jgi:hypothetical protein